MKALQRILSKSYAANLLSIRRITENSGKRTAGIDGELGGKWTGENLVLLHPVCHIQVHQNPSVAAALTISVKYA